MFLTIVTHGPCWALSLEREMLRRPILLLLTESTIMQVGAPLRAVCAQLEGELQVSHGLQL